MDYSLAASLVDQWRRDRANGIVKKGAWDAYNLEAPSYRLLPVNTPWRNRIARTNSGFGPGKHWRVTVFDRKSNRNNAVVGYGKRGGYVLADAKPMYQEYKNVGHGGVVYIDAIQDAKGFENLLDLDKVVVLNAAMQNEEYKLIGANNSVPLGTTPTPVLTLNDGGSLAEGAVSVICVALGYEAWRLATVEGGVQLTYTRNDAGGTTTVIKSGMALKSAAATVTATSTKKTIAAKIAAVKGAYGYAWFWGAAGSEKLGAITALSMVTISAAAPTNTPYDGCATVASSLSSTDESTSAEEYNGIIAQLIDHNSGAIFVDAGGASFSGSGSANSVQIDSLLQKMYNEYRISPTSIEINNKTRVALSSCMLQNGGTSVIREYIGPDGVREAAGYIKFPTYTNGATEQKLDIRVNPNLPDGMVVAWSDSIPAPTWNGGSVVQVDCCYDMKMTDYAMTRPAYDYDITTRSTPIVAAPQAFGILTNVAV